MVTVEQEVSWVDLEQRVRETTLLRHGDEAAVYPYENANIRLESLAYDDVLPTSLYVLRNNLAVQTEIAADVSAAGYHPLELKGGLLLKGEDGTLTGLVPPIVEETPNEGKYILDGAHRTSIGRWLGRTHFVGILISGIRPDCPGYALPNSWDEVKIREEVPAKAAEKKQYREGYRSLYRDFSSLNGSRLREV